MRPQSRLRSSTLRPLSFSLARLSSSAAVAAALLAAGQSAQAQTHWFGTAPDGFPGDGFLWSDPLNWETDAVPADGFDLFFAGAGATAGTILLNGNRAPNSLEFSDNYVLGAYGTNEVLTNANGNVNVHAGTFATINAAYGGTSGINLFGGGSLFLNHPLPVFAGNINISGAGSTLVYKSDGVAPQYNGVNSTQTFGRQDWQPLGYTTVTKTINLLAGGEIKIIGVGNNPEGGHKNILVGAGGGTVNIAGGFVQLNLDDVGQIANAVGNTLTLRGTGRLTIGGAMADANPLAGDVVVNGGIFELNRQQGGTAVAGTRFSGMTGTTSTTVGTNTLTINNGGTLMLNNGTATNLDVATLIANNGSIISTQGGGNEIGMRTQGGATPASTMQVNGTVSMLHRDLFGVQTGRNFFINSDLTGAGTLSILPSTQNASASRVVIQRSVASTFNGTLRLNENANLELNPRFNTVVDTGKLLADGDIDFAGWGSTLDLRDSDAAAANVKDYTTNEITITSGQAGSLNIIAPGRATATTGTGHLINFGTLTMGSTRLGIAGNNSYQTGFADTASIQGNSVIEMRADLSPLVFSNAAALSENGPNRRLTLVKTGLGSAGARDVIVGGAISISNLEVSGGNLNLRGANGVITTAFGGAAPTITVNGGTASGTAGPTPGVLNLDSSTGHVVGATTVFAAAENNNRIIDSATLEMRSNSTLRLTSLANSATTETIGTTNVSGHALFDVVRTGAPGAPVALTLTALNLTGTFPTVNFTGTSLGVAGNNARIFIGTQVATPFMPAQYHQGNEWAAYDAALGVTTFAGYVPNTAPATWVAGQHIKLTGASQVLPLATNITADTLNLQVTPANQTIDMNKSVLSLAKGGIISSINTIGLIDGATAAVPSGTAGITAGTIAPAQLYVHANAQIDIRTPVRDNLGANGVIGLDDNAVDFIKSGTGTVRMIHQNLGIGGAAGAVAPFYPISTTPTPTAWASTFTGNVVVNDGTLEVQRGEFLNSRPVVLNGGILFINQPVVIGTPAQAGTPGFSGGIIPNWGNNVTVNGNASLVLDDNGESNDLSAGGNALVRLGSLAINNRSTLSFGAFGNGQLPVVALGLTGGEDVYFPNGTTITGGKATLNVAVARSANTASLILGNAVTGNGFDVVAYGTNPSSVVLGGGTTDAVPNAYTEAPIVYGGTLRLNKQNNTDAIVNVAGEDLIINGGTVAWGPGDHGDLTTNNSVTLANNSVTGLTPMSFQAPFLAYRGSGANQIPDTATVTLLAGTLGEGDRINNDRWAVLNQKSGALNSGLGTMEIDTANITGGGLNMDRGGTLKVGTLNLLPGAYNPGVTTGIAAPGLVTTLEIGAGGLNMTGQNITVGSGSSGSVAGAGAVLKLGGNVTVTSSVLLGNSYNTGIYVQTGNAFREIGASRTDLAAGVRDFNIASDVQFFITTPLTNGGISKSGGGGLSLEPMTPSNFAGPVIVNGGVLNARADGAFGTPAGGVTVNPGGTVKVEGSWTIGDNFTISGAGALVPGDANVRELGALVSEPGTNRLTGGFALAADAKVASNVVLDPSVTPATGGNPGKISNLVIASPGGITGTGTLTLSGHGDGVIVNGLNTAGGGLNKEGGGRWTISGPGTYTGPTVITAGILRITNSGALGSAASGTTIFGGTLELDPGLFVAEPLKIYGAGSSVHSGAIVNVEGVNTLTGAIQLGSDATLRSNAGTFVLAAGASITGTGSALTLTGAGDGSIAGALNLGAVFSTDALTKNGRGTWSLTGNGLFTGSTRVNGGTLRIASPVTVLDGGSALNMGGGSILNAGPSGQASNGLNLMAGGNKLNGAAILSVGLISRNAGATATFEGNVVAVGTANDPTGILGSYATVGSDWATVNGASQIVAYGGYVDLSTAPATANANRTGAGGYYQITAPTTVNSLKLAGGSGLDVQGFGLTLTSGGLLHSSPVVSGIGGTGLISGPTTSDELVITTTGATLDIAAPLIGGSGGLTKAGNGTLVLSGNSSFTGPININAGTLSIVGPFGTTHPTALGSAAGPRNLNINGGTFEVVGGDYDTGATNMFYVIGSNGGTIRSRLGSTIITNDGLGGAAPSPYQLSGSGDLTYTGGGRYYMAGGSPVFPNFTGKITVDGGILTLGNSSTAGGSPDQTITVKANSAIINSAPSGTGVNGVTNNVVMENGSEMYGLGGNRAFSAVQFGGTHTVALMERDNPASERQIFLDGRVTGSGVTLNLYGAITTASVLYFAGGSNEITGAVNLNANTTLEVRTPGSLGLNNGDVTVNLNGVNSRLFLRNYQNGDYHLNVNAGNHAELGSDRLVNYAGGGSQLLTINNFRYTATDKFLTLSSGNGYTTRIAGTASFTADAIVNATGNALFENGIAFSGGATRLDKRGAGSIVLRGPLDNTGLTLLQGGVLQLQAGGTLLNTSAIDLRGGELRVDNSEVVNPDRVSNTAPITLAGGTLRITGQESIGSMTAPVGNSSVFFNQTSETVANTLTIPGLVRSFGATVNFGSDFGGAVGSATLQNARVSSRIIIAGQPDVTGNAVVPGYFGLNNLDFVQYDGTNTDAFTGLTYGVRELRNPTPANGPSYQADIAETAWTSTVIERVTTAKTLTAARALQALKVEAAITIAMAANNLRIESGGILTVGNAVTLSSTTGVLTAGAGVATPGNTELFLGGNNTLTLTAIVGDNAVSGQKVALVKTGTGTVSLQGAAANTYTGGTYVNGGTLNLTVNNALGPVSVTNKVNLNGGTLQFNIPSASSGIALGGLGHAISVGANSLIIVDNGNLAGINNSLDFGGVAITGPYTLGVRGFDSMDITFTGTHAFTGTPTIDLAQAGSGSNPNTAGAETFVTFTGAITGSGFNVFSSGATDNTQARLRIGGGASDATSNTYTGKVTILSGNNFIEDTFVELNKGNALNPTAITGDLELNAGTVIYNFDNQIAATGSVINNHGILNFNGKNATIASVNMTGGGIITNPTTAVQPFNTVNITGDAEVTGFDDFGGVTTGLTVGNNSTVNIGGQLRIGTYGRVHLAEGQSGAVLNLSPLGLQMTGALLSQNTGTGLNIVRLSGNVTTFPSIVPSRIGDSVGSATFLELNGTRTFTVADGPAGLDLILATVIRDSTAPVAPGSGLTKDGLGVAQIGQQTSPPAALVTAGATPNSYSGPTFVKAGTLVLFKTAGINAIGDGSATNTLTIGDGVGGRKADQVIIRNTSQIADSTNVTIASSGLLDLDTFNTSEVIGNLSGAVGSAITLGPTSILTVVSTTSTTYSGTIAGDSVLNKQGAGTLYLDGSTQLNVWNINVNAGTLSVDSDVNNAIVDVTGAANFGVSQLMTSLNINNGGIVTLGDLPGPPPSPFDNGGLGGGNVGADLVGASAPVQGVPEPGTATLLVGGLLTMLGFRRRRGY